MRILFAFCCFLSILTYTSVAYAYYDNSIVIEIGSSSPGVSTSSPGSSQSTSSDVINPLTGDLGPVTAGGDQGAGTNSVTTYDTNGGGTLNSNSSTSGSSASGSTDTTITILSELTASGAITESGGSSSGASNEGTSNTSASSTGTTTAASGGSNANGGTSVVGGGSSASATGGGTITLDGAKVRATLLGQLSFKDALDEQAARVQNGYYGATLTDQEVGLMAASTIVGDANIEQVTFGATRFEIVYRTQGFLFAIIPIPMPVRVAVDPQATGLEQEVTVTLPWYQFFVRRLFDTTALKQEIAVIVQTQGTPSEGETATQVKARLFTAVSLDIQRKIGTLSTPEEGGS